MESLTISLATIVILLILIVLITTIKYRNRKRKDVMNKKRSSQPSRTLAVLGSGGHTTEMIRLLSSLGEINYKPLYYIVASTDTTSINRLKNICQRDNSKSSGGGNVPNSDKGKEDTTTGRLLSPPSRDHIFIIPRAREVGQSYFTSIFTTILSILSSAHIILKTRPDILIINGPGTCLPIAFWTFVGRLLGICRGKIVFCESFCRVNSLSLTGTILMRLGMVDLFLVHWQELMDVINSDYGNVVKKHKLKVILIDSFIRHNT